MQPSLLILLPCRCCWILGITCLFISSLILYFRVKSKLSQQAVKLCIWDFCWPYSFREEVCNEGSPQVMNFHLVTVKSYNTHPPQILTIWSQSYVCCSTIAVVRPYHQSLQHAPCLFSSPILPRWISTSTGLALPAHQVPCTPPHSRGVALTTISASL